MNPAIVKFNGVTAETEITTVAASALPGPVQLACASGLPTGYSCSFEPPSLSQSGASHLSIHASLLSRNREYRFNAMVRGLALATLSLFSMLVFSRRRIPALLTMLCCVSLCVLSGCGGGSFQGHKQVAIVTIQTTFGSGQSHAVHSAQFILMIPDQTLSVAFNTTPKPRLN